MKTSTIVTAVTPDYVKRLKWTLPSWMIKKEFRTCPLIVFYHGMKASELKWIEECWPSEVKLINWTMKEYDSQRELMLSAFVLGAAQHVETEYYIKLDADAFCTSRARVFEDKHYELDLVSHPWGYSKPAWWIKKLEAWAAGESYEPPPDDHRGTYSWGSAPAKRIISFCCLHRTGFVREAANLAKGRLPVPSHDTYLWWLAEHVTDFKWARHNVKKRGVSHTSRERRIREEVCATEGAWNDVHMRKLLGNIQLELTSYCNLKCVNCDRACGQAPTKEQMSFDQVKKFVDEALEFRTQRGIDLSRIDLIGGEPTLHPDIVRICEEVKRYKDVVPSCKVRFSTNGSGKKVRGVLEKLKQFKWMKIRDSSKEVKGQPKFELVNLAPIDAGRSDPVACSIPWRCGLGLNSHGFYLCGAGAAVARVFGIDCAIKSMSDLVPQLLYAQRQMLCVLCGHSRATVKTGDKQETSKSWAEALAAYKETPPTLEVY